MIYSSIKRNSFGTDLSFREGFEKKKVLGAICHVAIQCCRLYLVQLVLYNFYAKKF